MKKSFKFWTGEPHRSIPSANPQRQLGPLESVLKVAQ